MSNTAPHVITLDNAYTTFWDIESLNNLFTVALYNDKLNSVVVFYRLDDNDEMTNDDLDENEMCRVILESNPALQAAHNPHGVDARIRVADLRDVSNAFRLGRMIGTSNSDLVNNPTLESSYWVNPDNINDYLRPVCDTDPDFDPVNNPEHGYLLGYNSYNYDTVMYAIFAESAFENVASTNQAFKDGGKTDYQYKPPTAREMRDANNLLFTEQYKKSMPNRLRDLENNDNHPHPKMIRQSLILSGRHVDVARLNEKQQRVGEKRLLAMEGHQILESSNLDTFNATLHSPGEVYALMGYNVADVVGLCQLAHHPLYAGNFELRKGLLDTYPETIYNKQATAYAPDVDPAKVSEYRRTPDSSSAQFAATILSPYGKLKDIETVSFIYPDPAIAAQLGIEYGDVLEESLKFFNEHVTNPEARAEFQKVYDFYANIRGKNFNNSNRYRDTWPTGPAAQSIYDMSERTVTIPYFDKEGNPTNCYVNFSVGGIHGAEYDKEALDLDSREYLESKAVFDELELTIDPNDFAHLVEYELESGQMIQTKDYLATGGSKKNRTKKYKTPHGKKATLYINGGKSGNDQVFNKKYNYTTVARTVHEDFASYYPGMLNNINAFYNPDLGENRNQMMFEAKQQLGKMEKDPSLSEAERELAHVKRNGTKLVLNAATGAGDAKFDNNIRMNNRIVSMRSIGQLMTWRVAQAQVFAGGEAPSTNTDGVYIKMDFDQAAEILKREEDRIRIEIEPEEVLLVSKDANNRLELMRDRTSGEWKIVGASGGSLACWKGPNPNNSLSHPAAMDYLLAYYLREIAVAQESGHNPYDVHIDKPFNLNVGCMLLQQLIDEGRTRGVAWVLRMFQNVIAASNGQVKSFPYLRTILPEGVEPTPADVTLMQHYSRVFYVKEGTPGAKNLMRANASIISASSKALRERNDTPPRELEAIASYVFWENGYSSGSNVIKDLSKYVDIDDINNRPPIGDDYDIKTSKVTNVEPHWPVIVENSSINLMDPIDQQRLLDSLDFDIYLDLTKKSFEENWMNRDRDTLRSHK